MMVTDSTKQDNESQSNQQAQHNEVNKHTNIVRHEEIASSFFDLRTTFGQILFLLITISISVLIQIITGNETFLKLLTRNVNYNNNFNNNNNNNNNNASLMIPIINNKNDNYKQPIYWIYGKSSDDSHLKHVHLVLKRLGFKFGTNNTNTWDLLWAHDYPFRDLYPNLHKLKAYQRVNHFPGTGFITNKVDFVTTTQQFSFIPKSFKLPQNHQEFLEYVQKNPEKLFVQKHNQHRFIEIKSMDEINFNDNNTFIQEFIDNPYLVDGHKFDIGVYVFITSIDPLRIYIYKGDVLFRYCPIKYYPFDSKQIDKYIVGDDYLPTWEIPSLSQYYNGFGFGMKDSFDAYVRHNNQQPDVIWEQIENAIRLSILSKEKHIINILKSYPRNYNFFELMRFDLVVDNNLKVYLMEANMSPNLSSAHFQQNTILYEQVIYNLFNLIGIGSYLLRNSLQMQTRETEIMLSNDKNIMVSANDCLSLACSSCELLKCKLCRSCLSHTYLNTLHLAYREHINRGDTKRIFPIPIKNHNQPFNENDREFKLLTLNNQLMVKWFYEKCKTDVTWCS